MYPKVLSFPVMTGVSVVCSLAEGALRVPLQLEDSVLIEEWKCLPFARLCCDLKRILRNICL